MPREEQSQGYREDSRARFQTLPEATLRGSVPGYPAIFFVSPYKLKLVFSHWDNAINQYIPFNKMGIQHSVCRLEALGAL